MVAQLFYDSGRFVFNTIGKPLTIGIVGAVEHEILPDENAHPITEFIEFVVFISPAGPNTEQIDMT